MNVHSAHVQARTAHGHGPEELLQVVWQVGAPGIAGIHSYEDADVGVQPHLARKTNLATELCNSSGSGLLPEDLDLLSVLFVPCLYG